jgi:hypothetical protein
MGLNILNREYKKKKKKARFLLLKKGNYLLFVIFLLIFFLYTWSYAPFTSVFCPLIVLLYFLSWVFELFPSLLVFELPILIPT